MSEKIIHVPSIQKLKATTGFLGSAYPFAALGVPALNMVVWDDDFLGDTIRGDATAPGIYEVVTGVDGAINILADQANGIAEIRASDGNGADTEYCGVSLPELAFVGDSYCGIAARIAVDAITTVKMEIGFTDVTTDAGFTNVLATPTFTAANATGWVFDTTDTGYWQAVGVKAGTAATKIEPSIAPVAATFEWLIVIIEGDNAKFYRLDANSNLTYESAWMADAIEGATQICPWIFVQLKAGTIDRNIQLDRLLVWGNRTSG
uniref:Uncharacterized protein n=1 Tax=viral metagenome TaxID=1070528 RepID=A0A6M3XXK6_9ZZZZ